MPRGALPALAGLDVADDPGAWRRLGFTVGDDGACAIGPVTLRITPSGESSGLTGWALRAERPLPAALDGIPTATLPPGEPPPAARTAHPNGATAVDHVVVATPNHDRTLAALEAAGLEVRRIRQAGTPERPLRQAFLWAGEVIVEVAGPPEPVGEGPARLWGLTVVAPDLDDLAQQAAPLVGTVRDAVQEGRRIATVRREAEIAVPLAFMTPHQRPAPPEST